MAALLEVQVENVRLRELLTLSGVNKDFIDNYVLKAVVQSEQFPHATNPLVRQINPNIGVMSRHDCNLTEHITPY